MAFRDALNMNDVNVIDGRILLWLVRMKGIRSAVQVTGHDLVRELIPAAEKNGYRVFLLGASANVAHRVARDFRIAHPAIQVESDDGGAFGPDGTCANEKPLIEKLISFRPHLLLVALREPKAELWISRVLPMLAPAVAVGVGGVFDTLVGALPRAPRWMQVAGLESAFQLLVAPGRYWRRYLFTEPIALLKAFIEVAPTRNKHEQ